MILETQTLTPNLSLSLSLSLSWPDESACQACAEALAGQPDIRQAQIQLVGPLGAGKTTFARHLLRALGVTGRIKSPSYAIVEPYEVPLPAAVASGAGSDDAARLPLLHFDFYRFNDPQEWEDAGFRELFASPGLKLVEWPEKAAGLLPPADLKLQIDFADDSANVSADPSAHPITDTDSPARRLQAQACSPVGLSLLQALRSLSSDDATRR